MKVTCIMPSSRIVDHLSLWTFSLQPPGPTVRSESEYPLSYIKSENAWRPGVGVISALQTSAQLVMLYYMGSKKHLPGRIVPLRVPFPGYACPKMHVRTAIENAGKTSATDMDNK